ncbi:hypothetical protein RYX45_22975, partial [Alkalihalophilus pseudofirmus]|nr:hypothetical protein [Alkalihalophilus pseudofirmus]
LKLTNELNLKSIEAIPVSATEGDNITKKSINTHWFSGKALLPYLESIDIREDKPNKFILPVQRVCHISNKFRGYQGQIETGTISIG